ncbi:MAG TPA: hypothetical protein VFG12_16315, partial [Rhodopila sp.]|nr:hypothetical protein [Rhodopila sp.]
AFVPKICSFWRIHGGSCMHSDNMWRSIRIYMDKQLREYPEHSHLIVRRFFISAIQLYHRASRNGVVLRQAFDFLHEIRSELPLTYRVLLAGGAPLLRTEWRFLAALRVRRMVRRLVPV